MRGASKGEDGGTTAGGRPIPLERYFSILEMLMAVPSGLTLNEIAAALALPKPTVHRLLVNMEALDLVGGGHGRGQAFRVGQRVRRLATLSADEDWVRARTTDILKRVTADLGETCYIARLDGHLVRSIAMESPDTPWRGFVLPGKILQPHATASGKAVMAYQAPEIVTQALAEPLERLTPLTLTDPAAVRAEFARIRETGLATCIGEVDENLAAAAVPLLTPDGVSHSLGVVGPRPRITEMIDSGRVTTLRRFAQAIVSVLGMGGEAAAPPAGGDGAPAAA